MTYPIAGSVKHRHQVTEADERSFSFQGIHTIDHGRTVLLILEDFDEVRGLFGEHFAKHGYDVFSAATLRDALAIAYEESPQAIIIDYDLSSESASHAIERLRDVLPNSYIVLVGGPNTITLNESALMAGASKVLSKAYDLTEINKIVEEAKIH